MCSTDAQRAQEFHARRRTADAHENDVGGGAGADATHSDAGAGAGAGGDAGAARGDVRAAQSALRRRPVLAAVAAVACLVVLGAAACGPAAEPLGAFPGRSIRPRGGATVAPPPSTPVPARWERWGEVASWRVAVERSPSQHLAADHEAETLANAAAAAYPRLGPARRLGPGAVLIQRLYAPGATEPDVLFAMERRAESPGADAATADAATWEYLILAPDGVVGERGALEACARCHAEAPHEGAFGRAQ